MSTPFRILGGLLVVALAMPALAQVTDEDIDRARTEVNRITARSAELAEKVTDAYGRQAALDHEISELRASIEYARVTIADTEDRLEQLAVQLYMGSTSGVSLSILFSATDQDYPAGMEYLREARGVDDRVVDQLRVFREELDRQTGRLGAALDEQVNVTTELEDLANQLQADLVSAQQVYDDLTAQQKAEEEERRRKAEEEERRRREAEAAAQATTPTAGTGETASTSPVTTTATPSVPTGSGACPVAGAVSFTDSWGAPRSGGRTHKGVDLIAARGVPIVAVYSGKVYRTSNSSLGGLSIYFTSDAGDLYYYAHLDGFADISPGRHMEAGEVLGYNGSTGNAPEWLPHLHFEYHPGGGSAVNPYPLARQLCG